jgi:hypothetical protein
LRLCHSLSLCGDARLHPGASDPSAEPFSVIHTAIRAEATMLPFGC